MFEYGQAHAEPNASWFWILDGDEFTTHIDITPDEIVALTEDAAEVRFIDPAEQSDIKLRNLFRAKPGLHFGPVNHYTFTAGDGTVLWGDKQVDGADLSKRLTMTHANHLRDAANHLRDAARHQAGQAYYATRDELGLETGACQRCGDPAGVRRLPHKWELQKDGSLRGAFGEFCLDCVGMIRKRNRFRLEQYGVARAQGLDSVEEMNVMLNNPRFNLRDLYWNWANKLTAAGWSIPDDVARDYDDLLEDGQHQAAGELVEPYRPLAA